MKVRYMHSDIVSMKMYYKSEVAQLAGVSRRTFQRWMALHRQELEERGCNIYSKFVHPKAFEYICQEYCIDIDSQQV